MVSIQATSNTLNTVATQESVKAATILGSAKKALVNIASFFKNAVVGSCSAAKSFVVSHPIPIVATLVLSALGYFLYNNYGNGSGPEGDSPGGDVNDLPSEKV